MPLQNTQAPEGAHFEFEEVKTKGGTKSLGEVPILVWDDFDAAVTFYGRELILGVLDGTSLRVSFQGIARRGRAQGKTDDDIAKAQVDFRPGTREVGQPTPVSRAARAARAAAERVDGDKIAAFLARVANGEISEEELASITGA